MPFFFVLFNFFTSTFFKINFVAYYFWQLISNRVKFLLSACILFADFFLFYRHLFADRLVCYSIFFSSMVFSVNTCHQTLSSSDKFVDRLFLASTFISSNFFLPFNFFCNRIFNRIFLSFDFSNSPTHFAVRLFAIGFCCQQNVSCQIFQVKFCSLPFMSA